MPEPDIAVIDCTLGWPRYSRRFPEILGRVETFRAKKQEFPESPDAVVITGSTSGVYEDRDWIKMLVEKTRGYIQDGVPVLGLCFGHQVIAKAMGARVVQMEDYDLGYRPVELSDTSVFQSLNSREHPFASYQDRVVDLPEELEVIARSDTAIQGIRHRSKPVFGVQFHPELTPSIARKSIRTKDIDEGRKEQLLEKVNDRNHARAERTLEVFDNFMKVVERHLSAPEQEM